MKKARIVILKEDKEDVLKALQRAGELMVIHTEDSQETLDSSRAENLVQRSQRSLQTLKPYTEKKGMFDQSKFFNVDYEDFVNPNLENVETLEQIEKADGAISRLKTENDACREFIKTLEPWSGLGGKLSTIYDSKYTKIHPGFVATKLLDAFMENFQDLESEVTLFGQSEDSQAVLIVNWHEDDEAVMEQIKSSGFMETQLPNEDKTIHDLVVEKQKVIEANEAKIAEIEDQLKKLATKEREIQIFQDQMATELAYKQTPLQTTAQTALIVGWCKAKKTEVIKEAVATATPYFDVEFVEPADDDDVPVALENNKFVSNFETLTDQYSHPSRSDLDPNPVMSVWYWMIFGMMMGDAGYGLLLLLATLFIKKFMKPKGGFAKLINIFFFGSITTMLWGILWGSYFGISEIGGTSLILWFNPQNEPLVMLVLTMIIGVVHLSFGLVMKCILCFREGQYFAGIFDNISWLVIMIGLCLALADFVGGLMPHSFFSADPVKIPPVVATIGYVVLAIGAAMVLFTAGRDKKGIGKVTGGLTSLYGVTSYISDILSYSRILALAMSGAIIAYVMNFLAGMVQSGVIGWVLSIVVYLVGHVFNIAMSLLSAYVHDSRLQYIEFYGKFYEGGGRDFKPLSLQYKYIYEINEKK
ncbi:V-type ATP synthase subunit I [bacterium]|jgi:V/A-type H+-transporting ATPase subunit I|nr:V-type ATP synthase subunit I [bacterium]